MLVFCDAVFVTANARARGRRPVTTRRNKTLEPNALMQLSPLDTSTPHRASPYRDESVGRYFLGPEPTTLWFFLF